MKRWTTWNEGPPPHVGWWLANMISSASLWSYWDGKRWSIAYLDCELLPAELRWRPTHWKVKWSAYYPKGARVKRINPETGEVTGPKTGRE